MLHRAPGIEDIFPDKIAAWNRITGIARDHFADTMSAKSSYP
jgi:hypothetical protein